MRWKHLPISCALGSQSVAICSVEQLRWREQLPILYSLHLDIWGWVSAEEARRPIHVQYWPNADKVMVDELYNIRT